MTNKEIIEFINSLNQIKNEQFLPAESLEKDIKRLKKLRKQLKDGKK